MTLEERVQAARAAKGSTAAPVVPLAERVKAIQANPKAVLPEAEGTAPAAPKATRKAKAPVDPDSFSSGVGRAVDNMQAAFGGTMEAIGEATGSQYLKDTGAQLREEQQRQAAEYGQPTAPKSYKDVDFGDASSVGSWASGLFEDSLPSMGLVLSGAAAGQQTGAAFGGLGRAVGGAIGGLLAGAGVNIGEVQNAIKAEDPNAESPWHSILAGTGMASLDAVGAGVMLKPLVKAFGKDVVYQSLVKEGIVKGVALDIVKGAATEGAIGAAQGVIQSVAVQDGLGKEIDLDRVQEDALNSALGGALLGSAIRASTGAMGRIAERGMIDGEAFDKAVTQADTDRQSVLGKVWGTFGGRSTDMLKGWSNASEKAREFVENFNPDETGRTATKKTVFEDAALLSGKWRTKWEELTKGKSKDDLAAIFDDVSEQHGGRASNPKVRELLDDVNAEAVKRGMKPGYIEGYLPLNMDKDAIVKNRDQFLQDILPYYSDLGAATKAIDEYIAQAESADPGASPKIDRLVTEDMSTGDLEIMSRYRKDGDPDSLRYKFGQGSVAPKFGQLEQSRAFGAVPQKVLNKYVQEQTAAQKAQAVKDYFDGASHRLAFVDRFGLNGEKANADIAKAVYEAQKAGRPVQKVEVDRMYDMLDAYNGMHGRVTDKRMRDIQSAAATVLTVKSLPLAAMSSLSEFMTPAIRGDIAAAMQALAPTFAQIAKDAARVLTKNAHRSEFSQMAAEANITFDAATSVVSERLGQNMFNRGAARTLRWYFIGNQLSTVTHFNRVFAAKTADVIYKRNLEALTRGLSINSPKGRYYQNQLRSMGVDVNTNLDAVTLFAPLNPSQVKAARDANVLAIRRFTEQSVLNPNFANTPMWMNDGRMQLLAMLKRYPSAFGNTILPQLARKVSPSYSGSYTRSAGAMLGAGLTVGLLLGIGYIQDEMKQVSKNGTLDYDENRTEFQRFQDVVNQVLMPLQMGIISDFFGSSRYGSSPIEVVAGPVAGTLKDARDAGLKTITSFQNDDPTMGYIGEFLFKQSPFRPFAQAKELISGDD